MSEPPAASDLPFTGERFVPGLPGEIWIEHWHRYHFAARWAAGRRVLDVACGEGYGSALLATVAAHVTGVDLSQEAVAHARRAYADLPHLAFESAPCTRLPLADASVDVAVSFETLEHIADQEAFLAEIARVLAPGGVLVLSCPDKLEYSDKRHYANAFHVRELYRAELAALLGARFPACEWYGQRPTFFSVIAPEGERPAAGQLVEVEAARPQDASPRLAHPLYFLVVAARDACALAAVPPALSVLSDRGDWIYRDYGKVIRELREMHDQRAGLASRVAELEAALAQREPLAAGPEREPPRPRGWRWWLRRPFVRLGLLD